MTQSEWELSRRLPRGLDAWLPSRHRPVAGFLWAMIGHHRGLVLLAFLANVAASLLEGVSMSLLYLAVSLLLPQAGLGLAETAGWLRDALEAIRGGYDPRTVFVWLVGVVALVQVMQSGLSFGAFYASAALRMRVRRSTMNAIAAQMMDLSFPAVSRYKTGELWSYMTLGKDIEKLIGVVNDGVYTVLMAVAYTVVLLMLSWPTTLVALAALALLTLGMRAIMGRIHAVAERSLDNMREMNDSTANFLAGVRLVRSFGLEKSSLAVLENLIDHSSRLNMQGSIWQAAVSPIIDVVSIVTLAGVMLAISLIFGDRIAEVLPTVLVFVFVIARLMPRLGHVTRIRANLHSFWPSARHTIEFLRRDDKEFARKGGMPFSKLRDGIVFKNVRLDYVTGERPALRDASFRIGRGEAVALVGESGAGKSSIVDLVLGLYDPTNGEILVDGVPLARLDLETWRHRIGVVSQDTFLYPASVRDNIAFGKPDASDDEIAAAAKTANAHEFISRLEKGYDTVLGDRGYRLSGGQAQRVALARAILRDPDVLILDEATSDLDSHSERLIQDALQTFRQGRTAIVVAHRLSTIRGADRILVMHEGRLVEQGTHDELVAQGGPYAKFWRLQTSGSVPASL